MLEASDVSYRYPQREELALRQVTLAVAPGECVALIGRNGCGKSTLARLLAGIVQPTFGSATLDGVPIQRAWHRVAMVAQDARSQLVNEVVVDEVAFGPRNAGVDEAEVARRVSQALEVCGLAHVVKAQTSELSGGEQQRLALAGALAMNPRYLVLDEPTSQLDPQTRNDVLHLIDRERSAGKGLVVVTHLIEEVLAADRVVVLDAGALMWSGTPNEFLRDEKVLEASGVLTTPLYDVARDLARAGHDVRTIDFGDARAVAQVMDGTYGWEDASNARVSSPECSAGGAVLRLDDVQVMRGEVRALDDFSCSIAPGHVTLVAGVSGSGKTTAALVATGALQCTSGKASLGSVEVRLGDVGLCEQRAEDQLFCATVLEDVAYGPTCSGVEAPEASKRAEEALTQVGVPERLWGRSPLGLSGGERRRVALAGILAAGQQALVLDEPTAGLDADGCDLLVDVARRVADSGQAVMVVSHDLDEWLRVADDVVLIKEGRVSYAGPAAEAVCNERAFIEALGRAPFSVVLRAAMGQSDEQSEDTSSDSWRVGRHEGAYRREQGGALAKIPAGVKVVALLAATVWVFSVQELSLLAVTFAASAALCALAEVSMRDQLQVLRRISVVLVLSVLANVLVLDGSGDIALFGPVALSSEGIARGARTVLRIVSLTLLAAAVARGTTTSQMVEAMLTPLRLLERLGVRTAGLRMTVTLALRCLPMSIDAFRTVEVAQRARGARLGTGPIGERLSSWIAVLVPMVVTLMYRADGLGDALAARGFGRETYVD